MQKVRKNWKYILILIVFIGVSVIWMKEKYFYNRLFSEKFCDSIIGIQYILDEVNTYAITDEKIVRDFADALCNNKCKELPEVNEGGYTFKLITEEEEYFVVMDGSSITWKGKEYEAKLDFFEILQEVWGYLEM